MKKELIKEELKKFKKLAGLPKLINESGGEKGVAELLIKLVTRGGERVFPKEIGEIVTKEGKRALIKVSYYEQLMLKDVLTKEEQDIVKTINTRIIKKVGTTEITGYIKNITKDLDNARRIFVENKILTDLFDQEVSNQIRAQLRGEAAAVQVVNVSSEANDILSNPKFTNALTPQEKIQLQRELERLAKDKLSTTQKQLELIEKFNDVRFKQTQQELDSMLKKADVDVKQQTQAMKIEAENALNQAKKQKAELDALIEAEKLKGAKLDNIAKNAQVMTLKAQLTKNLIKLGLWIAGIGFLVYGAYSIYKWFTTPSGGSGGISSGYGGNDDKREKIDW